VDRLNVEGGELEADGVACGTQGADQPDAVAERTENADPQPR
jgi:hypothetical protein